MKPNSTKRPIVARAADVVLLITAFLTLWLAPSRADDPQASPTESPKLSLRERGGKNLEQLPEVNSRLNRRLALLAKRNDKPMACSRSSLTSSQADGVLRYKYEDVSLLRGPNQEVIEAQTTAILTKDMHPQSIDWKFIKQAPDGTTETTTEQLKRGDGEFAFTRTLPDGKITTKRYPLPSKAYAYFTPYLVELIPLKEGDRFIINNLDPETGEIHAELYAVTARSKGGLRVGKKRLPGPLETEFFYLNGVQHVEAHGLAALDLTFELSTIEIVTAIEEALKRYRK